MIIIAIIKLVAFDYWFVVAAPFIAIGAIVAAFIGLVIIEMIKRGRAVKGILFFMITVPLILAAGTIVRDWISGPPTEIKNFDRAARNLHSMLTTTGNTDSEVTASCSAVEDAYDRVDFSRTSSEQQSAMKAVMEGARVWRLQLAKTKLLALQTQLGGDQSREIVTNIELSRLLLPGIRLSIESYLSRSYESAGQRYISEAQPRPSVTTNPPVVEFPAPPPNRPNYYPAAVRHKSVTELKIEESMKAVQEFYERQGALTQPTTRPAP
jgi:hypothetical protein